MNRWRSPYTGQLEPVSHWETMIALQADPRPPRPEDAPPLSTFPGKKARPLPGQLPLFGSPSSLVPSARDA